MNKLFVIVSGVFLAGLGAGEYFGHSGPVHYIEKTAIAVLSDSFVVPPANERGGVYSYDVMKLDGENLAQCSFRSGDVLKPLGKVNADTVVTLVSIAIDSFGRYDSDCAIGDVVVLEDGQWESMHQRADRVSGAIAHLEALKSFGDL